MLNLRPAEQQLSSYSWIFRYFLPQYASYPKSRATKRLMPHNRSPEKSGRKRSREEPDAAKNRHVEDRSGSSRSSRHHSRSPLRKRLSAVPESPEAEHTPAWAKKLLEAHNKSEERLQRLESELKSRPRSDKPGRAKSPPPDFKYKTNKVQYELNAKVLEKLEEAADASKEKESNEALDEGKKLLLERNKHIMLAEKYGWEAVDCYIQEPLACDSDDEKRIKRAVKESKALKLESKKPAKPRSQLALSSRTVLNRIPQCLGAW
ncbi:uncharacterized protein [Montipora capricornis]|uniref:uncharacterized protein n=1 Tax=Montipora capricornis TaxID=246305 RepID=UPI0035F15703